MMNGFCHGYNGYVKEQYLYLTGRQQDMLIIGGQNIYPAHVERLLTQVLHTLMKQLSSVFQMSVLVNNRRIALFW